MSDDLTVTKPLWRTPVLCVASVALVLAMVALGFWQLDRAEQKSVIVGHLTSRADNEAIPIEQLDTNLTNADLRFRKVLFKGRFLENRDFFVDNQVVDGGVGYQVFTPFKLDNDAGFLLIARGWVGVGESRDILPRVDTSLLELTLEGRLNIPPQKPPLWNDKYPVSNGAVWQYLPMAEVEEVLEVKLFPLVVELAVNTDDGSTLLRKWPEVNDEWVAKHQGYAFQWFTMALALFIASLVLLFKSRS